MANKLQTALRSHRRKDLRSDTFGRLWGAFKPEETWSEATLDMYLALFGACRRSGVYNVAAAGMLVVCAQSLISDVVPCGAAVTEA
jgi:hypothetical protein